MRKSVDGNDIITKLIRIFLSGDPEVFSYLDKDYILWKLIDGKLIGKRSVYSKDNRACWLEDAEIIKTWWCGQSSDYNEIFIK